MLTKINDLIWHQQRSLASLNSEEKGRPNTILVLHLPSHYFVDRTKIISANCLISTCVCLLVANDQDHMKWTTKYGIRIRFLCGRLASVNKEFVAMATRSYVVPPQQYVNKKCFNLIVYITHTTRNDTQTHAAEPSQLFAIVCFILFIQFSQRTSRWPLFHRRKYSLYSCRYFPLMHTMYTMHM